MKCKKFIVIAMLVGLTQLIFGTELEIINKSGCTVNIQPILSLAGRESVGKLFNDISNNTVVKYNSGIYRIIGFNIEMKCLRQRWRDVTAGVIKPLPAPLDIINTNAQLVLEEFGLIWTIPNKNNPKDAKPTVLTPGTNAQKWTEKWETSGSSGSWEIMNKD